MSDLIKKFLKSQMEGAANVDDVHLTDPQASPSPLFPRNVAIHDRDGLLRKGERTPTKFSCEWLAVPLSDINRVENAYADHVRVIEELVELLRREHDEAKPYCSGNCDVDKALAESRKGLEGTK